jgi:cytochrome c6
MTRNEIILGVVALVLIGFSLVVSLVVPRRRPEFPAPRLGLFVFVCVLLVGVMLATVEVFGGEEDEEAEAGEVREEEPVGETGAEEGTGGGAQEGGGDAARGQEVFAAEGCATCHTLEEAESTGTVGPNLDESDATLEEAVQQIEEGGGGMPAFAGQLEQPDIQAVATFVVESQGR